MSCVCLSSSSHSLQGFSHCSVRASSVLTPPCSLVRCLGCWQQSETPWNDSPGAAWMGSLLILFGFPGGQSSLPCDGIGGWGKGIWEQHMATDGRRPLSWERDCELLRVRTSLIAQLPDFCCSYFSVFKNNRGLWFSYPEHGIGSQILLLFISSLIALSYTQHKVQTYTDGKMMYMCANMHVYM